MIESVPDNGRKGELVTSKCGTGTAITKTDPWAIAEDFCELVQLLYLFLDTFSKKFRKMWVWGQILRNL